MKCSECQKESPIVLIDWRYQVGATDTTTTTHHTPTHQNVIAAIALIVALNPACQAKEYFVVERSQSYPFDERLIDLHGPTHPVIM